MKKLNFIRYGIVMSFLLNPLFTYTQSLTFTQAMDSVLAPLDKNRITTGILYDRIQPFANIDLYNIAVENPPPSNFDFFMQAYNELFYSAYNTNGWIKPEWLRTWAEGETYENRFSIGLMDYQFNVIDSNAVNNGLLSFSNNQLHDVSGVPSPYWTKRIQMTCILSEEIPSGLVNIYYNANFFKTNMSVQVSSIQLNFGSIGTYTLTPSNPVVQINFTGSGIKELISTVQYSNGTSFSNAVKIKIGQSGQTYSAKNTKIAAASPNDSLWISGKYSFQGYEETYPAYGKAKISIWWKLNSQNQPVPGIVKPVIIVDGIDALDTRPNTAIYDLFNYKDANNAPQNFGDELRANGFDIIVMDMPKYKQNTPGTINDPTSSLPYPKPLYDAIIPDEIKGTIYGGADYIQRNAYVLEYLIDYCNQQMLLNGSNEKIVLVGPSMGGQITRYALRDMERRNINHNSRLWISFDSPHQGAYVPVGLQYSIAKIAEGKKELAKRIRDIWINSPTSKQTALHHYLSDNEDVTGAPGFFNQYYQEINGDPQFGFPQAQGLRKIAMLSGSDLGVPQPFGAACQLATEFKVRFQARGIGQWLFLNLTPDGWLAQAFNPLQHHKTYLAPATGECVAFRFIKGLANNYSKTIKAPTWSNTSLDMLQGGFFPAFSTYRNELDAGFYADYFSFWERFLTLTVNDYVGNGMQEPTYSTLGVGLGSMPDPTRKWDANFRLDKFNQPVDVTCPETQESPFDMYWAPDINTRHDSLLLGHVVRLRKEIIDKQAWTKTQIQRQVSVQSTKDYLCNGESATLSINQPYPNMTYSWTSSNPSINITPSPGTTSAVIQNNGSPSGYYQINVQASSPCYIVSGSFTIHLGVLGSSDYPITGPSQSWCGYSMYFSTLDIPGATNYNWFWPSNWYYINGQGTRFLTLQTPSYGSYLSGVVGVRVDNVCGSGGSPSMKYVQITCGGWRISASPNPTTDNIIISTTQNQKQAIAENNQIRIYQIRIIDQLGNVKKQYSYSGGITNTSISTLNLAAGVYILQAYNGESWATTKFVKQ